MSVPVEADYALVKLGDGGGPEIFTAFCGLEGVSRNNTAQTSERYRRDCAAMHLPAQRRIKCTGTSQTISANGGVDKADIVKFETALGKVKNYKIEMYQSSTGAAVLYGTYSGAYMLTASNMQIDANGDSSGEITLENDGAWTWTPAP